MSATKRDELPEEFTSLREAGEFWDTHDSGEYEDAMTGQKHCAAAAQVCP